jgi:cytidyltransferase-like protein
MLNFFKKAKPTLVIASGYFRPLHIGHLNYLYDSARLGDRLLVIINNDRQVKVKKSIPFMNECKIATIIECIKPVNQVMISIDTDETVNKTLKMIHGLHSDRFKLIFVKGGDRTYENIPERATCEELGIKLAFNLGGGKEDNSSEILKQVREYKG